MKAAVYCCVSTKAQAEEGSSLESQERGCKRLAEARGLAVAETFREDWPGDSLDRPLLRQPRDRLKEGGYKAIICYSTDRLARKPVHLAIIAEECEKAGAELIFVTEPLDNSPEGQLIRYVRGYAAEVEREKIRERTVRGKQARAAKGMLPQGTGKGAYGYRYDPATGRRTVIESEAAVVCKIFRMCLEGWSFHGIAQKLNRDTIATFSGGRWHPLTVRRLVTNPIYKGETYFGQTKRIPLGGRRREIQARDRSQWLLVPGATPPVVTPEEFEAANTIIKLSRRKLFAAPTAYLLRSHIRCGYCDTRMTGSILSHRYRYYYCRNTLPRYATPRKCPARYVRADWLESEVWAELCRIIESPQVILSEIRRRRDQDTPILEQEIAEARNDLKSLEDQEKRLVKLFQFSEVDEGFVRQQLRVLRSRQEQLEAEVARLRALQASAAELDEMEARVTEWTKRVHNNLNTLSFEERQLVLDALDVTVVVAGDKWELKGSLPSYVTTARTWGCQYSGILLWPWSYANGSPTPSACARRPRRGWRR